MQNSPEELTDEFAKQICEPLGDVAVDYAELALDALIENEAVREIPFVRTVAGLYRGFAGIRERQFVRKLLTFLREIQSEGTEGPEWQEFRERIGEDQDFRRRCTEHLLIIIDRFIEEDKAKIAGQLFLAYIDGKIDWERFVDLTLCLERLHRRGYDLLAHLCNSERGIGRHGRFRQREEGLLFAAGIVARDGTMLSVTPLGVDLYNFGVKLIYPSEGAESP